VDRRPCALVVTRDLALAASWMAWLRGAGYVTIGCVGPELTLGCPRAAGLRCPPHEVATIRIVDAASDVARSCRGGGDDGATITIPRGDPAATDRRAFIARVGAAGAA